MTRHFSGRSIVQAGIPPEPQRRKTMNITKEQLAQMIDHTNLKAFSQDAAFRKLCDEAKTYGFKAIAINGAQIELLDR